MSSPQKKSSDCVQGEEQRQREEESVQETHDEIEKFIAEMEKDQDL